MAKEIEVKIPDIQSINLLQLQSLKYIQGKDKDSVTTEDMTNFVHHFCGVDKYILEDAKMISLIGLFYECVGLFNDFKVREKPLEEITIKGNKYTLRRASNDLPSSWFTTSQGLIAKGIESHEIAALSYVEKGMEYNHRDKDVKRRILNPLRDRADLFLTEFKAVDYMPLNAFFLSKLERYRIPFLILQKERIKNNKVLRK